MIIYKNRTVKNRTVAANTPSLLSPSNEDIYFLRPKETVSMGLNGYISYHTD